MEWLKKIIRHKGRYVALSATRGSLRLRQHLALQEVELHWVGFSNDQSHFSFATSRNALPFTSDGAGLAELRNIRAAGGLRDAGSSGPY
jgi:hypothetical protein